MLRAQYAAEHAKDTKNASLSNKRPTPASPAAPSSPTEEKAMLRARYAAEDAKDTKNVSPPYMNGNGHQQRQP